MVRSALRLLPVAALAVAAGCFPYRRTIFYRAPGEPPASGAPAETYVLDICRQWIAPLPHVGKGWCFELRLRGDLLREGAVIAVPGEGARPLLRVIPSMRGREAAGTVRVRRVEPGRILADVDLEDRATGWSLRRSVWFRPGEPPPAAPIVPGTGAGR